MYTRQGCHLCEDAWEVLRRARRRYPLQLAQVDIDTDPELVRAYGLDIPVIVIDGQVRFRGFVNPVLLNRLLQATPSQEARGGEGDTHQAGGCP